MIRTVLFAAFLIIPQGTQQVALTSFLPTRPYVSGTETVVFAARVVNPTDQVLEGNGAYLRFLPLTGLEVTSGETLPKLPSIEPNSEQIFLFKARPVDTTSPLTASVSLESGRDIHAANILYVPRFERSPSPGSTPLPAAPRAVSGQSWGLLENQKLRLRVQGTAQGVAAAFLWTQRMGEWRLGGFSCPMTSIASGEPGQSTWTESFRAEDFTAVTGADSALLSISGALGNRWRATIDLVLASNSGSVDARLRLSPVRTIVLEHFDLMNLSVITPNALITANTHPKYKQSTAWNRGITSSGLWASSASLPGSSFVTAERTYGVDYQVLGGAWQAGASAQRLDAGALITAQMRLHVRTPSASPTDVAGLTMPASFPTVRPAPPKPPPAAKRSRSRSMNRRSKASSSKRKPRTRSKSSGRSSRRS